MDALLRTGRLAGVEAIREVVANELGALLRAHKVLEVAQRLHDESPDNRSLADRVTVAQEEKREATQLLKAALHAHGYTYQDLQHELAGSKPARPPG